MTSLLLLAQQLAASILRRCPLLDQNSLQVCSNYVLFKSQKQKSNDFSSGDHGFFEGDINFFRLDCSDCRRFQQMCFLLLIELTFDLLNV